MKEMIDKILNKPERIFLILGLFFGLLSMFMMPVLTIPDEGAHFWMSYGMFTKSNQIPKSLLISAEDSAASIKNGSYFEKIFLKSVDLENDTFSFNVSKSISINSSNANRSVSSFDLPHLPQAVGILIGKAIYPSVGMMVIMGRLFNFALFIVAIYLIIKKIKYGKLALTFLALFPMIIHQAASLSYDVLNIVIIFAWVAFMINLSIQKTTITKKQVLLGVLLGIIMCTTKPTNLILFGLLPFISQETYKNTAVFKTIRNHLPKIKFSRKYARLVFTILVALFLTICLWVLDTYLKKYGVGLKSFLSALFNTFFRTDINTQLDPIVTTGIVGHFGWLWYKLPEWLVILHLSIFGIILLGEKTPKISRRFALVSIVILFVSVLAITVGMYFAWTVIPSVAGSHARYIQGMQGRYFTPLLMLFIPLFAYLQQYIKVKINKSLLYKIAFFMAIFSLIVFLMLTYIFFYTSI